MKKHLDDICQMMNAFGLNARTIERRKGVYHVLEKAEKDCRLPCCDSGFQDDVTFGRYPRLFEIYEIRRIV